jgi:hypothetical protein
VRRIRKEFAEFWFGVEKILTEMKSVKIIIKDSYKREKDV